MNDPAFNQQALITGEFDIDLMQDVKETARITVDVDEMERSLAALSSNGKTTVETTDRGPWIQPTKEAKIVEAVDISTVERDGEMNDQEKVADVVKRVEFEAMKQESQEWEEKLKALQKEFEAIKAVMMWPPPQESTRRGPDFYEVDLSYASLERQRLVLDDSQQSDLRSKGSKEIPNRGLKHRMSIFNLDHLSPNESPDQEMHVLYGESSFTLIYLYEFHCQAFWYGMINYVLQISTICLVLVDLIDVDDIGNPLGIPPMVGIEVTLSQALSLFTSLAMQSDLIESVIKLQDRYHSDPIRDFPGATFSKWLFSCLAQMFAGLLLMVASFVLTMQVDSVINVMLNLTALHFMAGIDDLGFAMARMGFITTHLQKEAEDVVDYEVPKRRSKNYQRRILYFLSLIGLFTGYVILKNRQLQGYYLPSYVYVQFGGAVNYKIPYFSGVYSFADSVTDGYRQYRDIGTGTILLGYCTTTEAWTFTETDDPCDFLATSVPSVAYDVTTIPFSDWKVKDPSGGLHTFEAFTVVNQDCDPSVCKGICNADDWCECPHDRFGMNCEFSAFCTTLVIDARFELFPPRLQGKYGMGPVDSEYNMLRNPMTGEYVRLYDMPVYYSNQTAPANIIFFGGRRWLLIGESDLFDWNEAKRENPDQDFFPEKASAVLENNFHAYHKATYLPLYFTAPVDYDTPAFLPNPAGLVWWTVRSLDETARKYRPDFAVETILTCASCLADEGGFCNSEGGTCNSATGFCDCFPGYNGNKCELQTKCFDQEEPCTGRGSCDKISGVCKCNEPWFGNICEFKYLCSEEYGQCHRGGLCNASSVDRLGEEAACDCGLDPAIAGLACEKYRDCRIHGCANGGFCGKDGMCFCRPPFYGSLCNMVNASQDALFCRQNGDCMNGICDVLTGTCRCEEPTRYGTLCEHVYNCRLSECLNGGECSNSTGVCSCPEPYLGPDCSQEPNCYEDSYCQSFFGRYSVCNVASGRCECTLDKTLKHCDTVGDNCGEKGCKFSGFCNQFGFCECEYPHTGAYCDYSLAEPDDGGIDVEFPEGYSKYVEACIQEKGFPPYNETHFCK